MGAWQRGCIVSLTKTDWLMVATTMRKAKPVETPGFPPRMQQWETDCWALAAAFKDNAERQGQRFDVLRFVRDCGLPPEAKPPK